MSEKVVVNEGIPNYLPKFENPIYQAALKRKEELREEILYRIKTGDLPNGLYPLLKNHMHKDEKIIIDSKSGTTGAGKSLTEDTHFPKCNESFHPYKIASHRHTPEIEQELSKMAHQAVHVMFTPHLLPVNRGIISTIYVPLKDNVDFDDVYDIYQKTYQDEYFIRVLPKGQVADLKFVQYSNFCDISLHYDERYHQLIVVSTIDNMVKGAAGQAIQNMNLMYGFDEKEGLMMVPASF